MLTWKSPRVIFCTKETSSPETLPSSMSLKPIISFPTVPVRVSPSDLRLNVMGCGPLGLGISASH